MAAARIRGLILTVGGSPEPLSYSISQCRPERVALVHTRQTAPHADEVERSVRTQGLPETHWQRYAVASADELKDCHVAVQRALRDMLAAGLSPREVAVDFTGGTKAMSAAAALAVAEEGCRFVYVTGWERNKEGVGTVLSGRERVVEPLNPWEVLEEGAVRRAVAFADRCLWPAAIAEVDAIHQRCGEKDQDLFRLLKEVLTGLERWDGFDHAGAWQALGGRIGADRLPPDRPRRLRELAGATEHISLQRLAEAVQQAVGALARVCLALGKPPDRDPDPLVVDLVANADRRAAEGRLDEAFLRLYRALELQADRALRRTRGFGTDAVPGSDLPAELRSMPGVFPAKEAGLCELGLDAACRLLAHQGDPFGLRYVSRTSRLDVSGRNRSWLVHGQDHISEAQFQAFRRDVLDLLDAAQAVAEARWPRLS